MADEWIKVEKGTPSKPEMAILARLLGVSVGEAFAQWFQLYCWFDGATHDGEIKGLSMEDIDALARVKVGTCAALSAPGIGWVDKLADEGGVRILGWHRHMSSSARARELEREAKKLRRDGDERWLSDKCRTNVGQMSDKSPPKMSDQERRNGDGEEEKEITERQAPYGRTALRAPLVNSGGEEGEARPPSLDLSGVTPADWAEVCEIANRLGRKIPPAKESDRRQWLRYALLAVRSFSEDWLWDSVAAVQAAAGRKGTIQAHFVGVLTKQVAARHGLSREEFRALVRRIDIPDEIWKSDVLPTKGTP